MSTVRIYKVAELLDTTSQEVLALLKRDHGIELKSASSTIEELSRDHSSSASPVSAASHCRAATCSPNIRCPPRVRRRRRPRRNPSRQSRRLRSSVRRASSRPSSPPHRRPPRRSRRQSHHRRQYPNRKSSNRRRPSLSCLRRCPSPNLRRLRCQSRKSSLKSRRLRRRRRHQLKKRPRRLKSPLLSKLHHSPRTRRLPHSLLAASCHQRFGCASKNPGRLRNLRDR